MLFNAEYTMRTISSKNSNPATRVIPWNSDKAPPRADKNELKEYLGDS